jgi:GTP-binding protein
MSLPVVAIVGRPNVGKSSLFNALVGRQISIVDPTPGVTRDRVSSPCALVEAPEPANYVELVDTGGMGIEDMDHLTSHVENQITYALAEAALIVFVVDARDGVTPLDRHVAQRLRREGKPVLLVANKVDRLDTPLEVGELHGLGFGEPMRVSATHKSGRLDLLDRIAGQLAHLPPQALSEPVMKLAVVGKRNAGKSTFINSLAGQERVIVSETPGTTRDSVDVRIELDGQALLLIDTAGVRKRSKVASSRHVDSNIEYYSMHRALRSIRRADVVALLIDASLPVSQVDKDLAGQIAAEFKPVVLVVNKWDLAAGKAAGEDFGEYFDKVFPDLAFAPISLTTASKGVNVQQTIRLAQQLFQQTQTRVPTAELNRAVEEIVALRGPSHKTGTKPPKLLYATQISTAPPTIVCFVNDVRSFDRGYQRFLLNQLRLRLPIAEVPIRLLFRGRKPRALGERIANGE